MTKQAKAPAAAKAAKGKKAPAAKAPAAKAKAPRAARLAETAKIQWLVKTNPKREGSRSHARFSKYMGKPTVGAYIAAGGTMADLRWDAAQGYLKV